MSSNIVWLNIKARVFAHLPDSFKYSVNATRILPRYLHWRFHEDGWRHANKVLAPYQNKYMGYRCIVIGNGPSLKRMDLSVLKNEFTFGLNRIYLLFDKWGFSTTFLVSVNRLVLQQFGKELQNVDTLLKVFSWTGRKYVSRDERTAFLAERPGGGMDGQILQGYYRVYGTVTNIALQLAYFMGFSEVILIGIDHNFAERGIGGRAVVSRGPDQNHFSEDYFGNGVAWQLPDYVVMEYAYRKNLALYQRNGRKIVDATPGGNLMVFPKTNFTDYLRGSEFPNKFSFEKRSSC